MSEGARTSKILTLEELKSDIYKSEFWKEMPFGEYLNLAHTFPSVSNSAYQRMYKTIVGQGMHPYKFAGRDYIHYTAFDDPWEDGKDAVFGLDRTLMRLVDVLRAGAARLGQERRIILMHGPVGSCKTTIARLLRKGIQANTKTDAGQLYTYSWLAKTDEDRLILGLSSSSDAQRIHNKVSCPVHEGPLMLLPPDARGQVVAKMNCVSTKGTERGREELIEFEGELCPVCRLMYQGFLRKYKGDWKKVISEHIEVRRLIFSEVDRIGIGSFRPKDEKNQDSTELTGDMNYRKIAEYGSESDPRAFNFDGEFQVSHRGFFYVEEALKLDKAFLYDFLGASQEHVVKPKRFAEMFIDEVLMAGTNNPEYEKLREDDSMEAFRDRTTRVDVPYVLRLDDEKRIYNKVYATISGGKHIAPHTREMASLWAIFTRLKNSEREVTRGLKLRDKARPYNGKGVHGYTDEHVQDLLGEHPEEGMSGISPRYVNDMIGAAIVKDLQAPCTSWFAVKRELEDGLKTHSLIKGSKGSGKREDYLKYLSYVMEEFDNIVKEEVQEAVAGDENDLKQLFEKYVNHLVAYINGEKVLDHRGERVVPDERLMREVEEKIEVSPQHKDEFRRRAVQTMGTRARRKEEFNYKTDERLYRALRLKLFEDRKDTINLSTLHTGVIDPGEQEKIEVVKKRLKQNAGYCDHCATLVLNHVASIFARGTSTKNKA